LAKPSSAHQLNDFHAFVDAHPELSQEDIGKHFDLSQSAVSKRRAARKRLALPTHGVSIDDIAVETIDLTPPVENIVTTTLQRVELAGEPVNAEAVHGSAELQAQVDALRADVAELMAHQHDVDAWRATIQYQLTASAVQTVQSLPVQTFDDSEDGKPERWNLWLPRGLKRRLEAQAKAAGIAPSQLVQRLLMATLNGTSREEMRHG
jgi:hypothetical protein